MLESFNVFAKVDAHLRGGIAAALGLLALGLLFWAAPLLLIQCTTWLKTGIWQPVPAFAVLLSPEAQTFNLRLTDGHLTPLDLPSWAAFDSLDAVAARAAGNMVGLAQILRWVLDTALGFWLVTLAFACATVALDDSAPTSGTK